MLLTRDERTLIVSMRGTPARLAFVDTRTRTVTKTLDLAGPGTLGDLAALSADDRIVYATFDRGENGTGGVAVVDIERRAVIDTWDYPGIGRVHGIAAHIGHPPMTLSTREAVMGTVVRELTTGKIRGDEVRAVGSPASLGCLTARTSTASTVPAARPAPRSWTGIRDAISIGPAAPQPPMEFPAGPRSERMLTLIAEMRCTEAQGENCLVLNVWEPTWSASTSSARDGLTAWRCPHDLLGIDAGVRWRRAGGAPRRRRRLRQPSPRRARLPLPR